MNDLIIIVWIFFVPDEQTTDDPDFKRRFSNYLLYRKFKIDRR